jgi:hypothetical protein
MDAPIAARLIRLGLTYFPAEALQRTYMADNLLTGQFYDVAGRHY